MAKYPDLSLGQIEAIANKLGGMEGIERFLRGETEVVMNPFQNDHLRILPRRKMFIPATDGQLTIRDAAYKGVAGKKLFWRMDHAFEYRLIKPDVATPETEVKILEHHKGLIAEYELFASLGKPFADLCFTQHQIATFCNRYREEVCGHGKHGFMFLMKDPGYPSDSDYDEFIVVHTYGEFVSGSEVADVRESQMRFKPGSDKRCPPESRQRIVVPATAVI